MNILHTEASLGWGGQEIRLLREACAMKERGHNVVIVVGVGGKLATRARDAGLPTYEVPFSKPKGFVTLRHLSRIIKKHHIDIINTHSSLDAWLGGIAAKLNRCKVVRTRHLSTNIRAGLNSIALYKWLADQVVTTCEFIAAVIRDQANISIQRCRSVPTGLEPSQIAVTAADGKAFREEHGIKSEDIVIGTLCVVRRWKGIADMVDAANILKEDPRLKWVIVGEGPSLHLYQEQVENLGLKDRVLFVGHKENPYPAVAAMDIFTLLSTGHEGVSQASLQAAYLGKPMVTTLTGGLGEVCLDGITGYNVDNHSPEQVAEAVAKLVNNIDERKTFGQKATDLVKKSFLWDKTINDMEKVYSKCLS